MDTDAVYRDSLVWDDHAGFELLPDAPLDPLLRPWREAGVGYLSINVYFDPRPWTRAIENIAALRRRLPDEAPYCRLVSSVEEVDRARAEGMMAVTFDIEGMNALDGRLELVELYYDLGVRHMLFAYKPKQSGRVGLSRRGHGAHRLWTPGDRGDEPGRHGGRLLAQRLQDHHGGDRALHPTGRLHPLQRQGAGRSRSQYQRRADQGLRGQWRRDRREWRRPVPRRVRTEPGCGRPSCRTHRRTDRPGARRHLGWITRRTRATSERRATSPT